MSEGALWLERFAAETFTAAFDAWNDGCWMVVLRLMATIVTDQTP